MKHTPGPWKWDQPSVFNAAGIPIAHIFNHLDPKEKEANAQLIASAPDLLEALKSVLDELPQSMYPKNLKYMQKAIAAIAKAQGE